MRSFLHTASVAVLLLALAAPAYAALGDTLGDFDSAHRWQLRLRGVGVIPDEEGEPSPINGKVTADDTVVPELDITYFWTDNIATELILATTQHDMRARGTTSGDLSLGSVRLLPPTLTVQYHFMPDADFRPYLGAGINYTIFFDENPGDINTISYDDAVGYAFQAGMDHAITDHWMFNIDVKKVFLNTDVSINGGAITASVDLDPWLVGMGFGYRF